VYLKWNPPPDDSHNGAIVSYQVVIQGGASWDVLSNVTVSASTPTLLLTNLTSGVRYRVMIAAVTKVGFGPFTDPIVLPTEYMNQIKYVHIVSADQRCRAYFVSDTKIVLRSISEVYVYIIIPLVRFTALDIRLQRGPWTKFDIPLFLKCATI